MESRPEQGLRDGAADARGVCGPATGCATRLLVVDDERVICKVLERYLCMEGYDVQTAASVATGLLLLERTPFAVMICDVRLPDGSGLDLIRRARELQPHLAILASSGQADQQTQATALRNGAAEFLTKPVALTEFGRAVRSAEARRRTEMAAGAAT